MAALSGSKLFPMLGVMPDHFLNFCHGFGAVMRQGLGKPGNGFFHAVNTGVQFGINALSPRPVCVSPVACINGKLTKR